MQEINVSDLLRALRPPPSSGSTTQGINSTAGAALATTNPIPADQIQTLVKQKSDAAFGPQEWGSLHQLLMNESGFNPEAQNPNSSAYGLGQFLDSTWQSVGIPKTSDPSLQADAVIKYIQNRYQTPSKALDFWNNVAPTVIPGNNSHWY